MKKKIMVVDDDEDIRVTLKTILCREGYNISTAIDGDDCLKKIKKEKPDFILMDIMMPGTPVRDVVNKIKDTNIAYLSVVRTSEAEKEDLFRNKNVVDFIQKPFEVKELISRVKSILRN